VPNTASPFLDTQAPAQWSGGGGSGAPGPFQATLRGNTVVSPSNPNYNDNLNVHLAVFIAGALILVFVLQQTGFRFVVAAGVGGSR
jgi:hypothetical protein